MNDGFRKGALWADLLPIIIIAVLVGALLLFVGSGLFGNVNVVTAGADLQACCLNFVDSTKCDESETSFPCSVPEKTYGSDAPDGKIEISTLAGKAGRINPPTSVAQLCGCVPASGGGSTGGRGVEGETTTTAIFATSTLIIGPTIPPEVAATQINYNGVQEYGWFSSSTPPDNRLLNVDFSDANGIDKIDYRFYDETGTYTGWFPLIFDWFSSSYTENFDIFDDNVPFGINLLSFHVTDQNGNVETFDDVIIYKRN